jgi:hypothetical protein
MRDIPESFDLPGGGVATFVNGRLRLVRLADDTELEIKDGEWIVKFPDFHPERGEHEIAAPDDKFLHFIVRLVDTCRI